MDTAIRILADGMMIPIVGIGAYFLVTKIPHQQKLSSYSRMIMAGLTALLLAKLIGSIWQPDAARPFIEMGVAAKAAYLDNAGFPSDHVLFGSVVAFAVWFEARYKKIALLLFLLVGLVAVGRVLALVHTPLDCLGGFIFAAFGALWYLTKPREIKKT
jgi:membrane-associated phospholipid phosphatase